MQLNRYILSLFLVSCGIGSELPVEAGEGVGQCQTPRPSGPVELSGGIFLKGSNRAYPEEAPVRQATVNAIAMDRYEVTNRQFEAFVEATGYMTVAERHPDPEKYPEIDQELLVPGSAVFVLTPRENQPGYWSFVAGANWRHPEGTESQLDGRMDHPVVHISYEDALAYAQWRGGDLPTEDEWEYASKSGHDDRLYEWGNTSPSDQIIPIANTWQGFFPYENTAVDGYFSTAPVGCYKPNDFGLYDMTGNVWEWVRDANQERNVGIIKGGSYLCAENFCRRYRPSARQNQELDFSTNHIGFRVVYRDR